MARRSCLSSSLRIGSLQKIIAIFQRQLAAPHKLRYLGAGRNKLLPL
jgi:hypothetical protein